MAEGQRTRRVLPNEDLSNVEFETSEDVEVLPAFDSMDLREDLLRGIYAYGMYSQGCRGSVQPAYNYVHVLQIKFDAFPETPWSLYDSFLTSLND